MSQERVKYYYKTLTLITIKHRNSQIARTSAVRTLFYERMTDCGIRPLVFLCVIARKDNGDLGL